MSLKLEAARSLRVRVADEMLRPRATELAVRLADQVRRLRIHTGLTQAELAARAGVTVETVARLDRVLRGRLSANANPSLETMERIGSALGVEVAELLSAPNRQKPHDDRLSSVLRGMSPATKRRVIRVAEALVRDDRSDAKPALRRR
ncbi:MAG: helix-turn-helix domain-containing protein [Pseudomonadota bacterium]